jgi:hypothetical protein
MLKTSTEEVTGRLFMVEVFRINQTRDVPTLVQQLNQILRRISELLGAATTTTTTTAAGLTEGDVRELIRQFIEVSGFGDADNFLFLPGREGGQVANGGTVAGEDLEFAANSANETLGNIILRSPTSFYDLNEDSDTTTGLTWGFNGGTVRQGVSVTTVTSGTVALVASTTNFVEIDAGTGVVSAVTGSFTLNKIPLRELVTDGSDITGNTDSRTWIAERGPVQGAFVWVVTSTVLVSSNASHFLRCTVPGGVDLVRATIDVKTAPTGDEIIADVVADGSSVFDAGGRPQVLSSATTGNSTNFSTASLTSGALLQLAIDQVGSTVAGADLTLTLEGTQKR